MRKRTIGLLLLVAAFILSMAPLARAASLNTTSGNSLATILQGRPTA